MKIIKKMDFKDNQIIVQINIIYKNTIDFNLFKIGNS